MLVLFTHCSEFKIGFTDGRESPLFVAMGAVSELLEDIWYIHSFIQMILSILVVFGPKFSLQYTYFGVQSSRILSLR